MRSFSFRNARGLRSFHRADLFLAWNVRGTRAFAGVKEGNIVSVRPIALLVLGLALTTGASAAPVPQLEIHHFKFSPATVTVAPGTTVRWVNRDEETHTVTSSAGLFASAGLDTDE